MDLIFRPYLAPPILTMIFQKRQVSLKVTILYSFDNLILFDFLGAFSSDRQKIPRSDLIKSVDLDVLITPNEGSSILPQYEKYTINVTKQLNQPLGKVNLL